MNTLNSSLTKLVQTNLTNMGLTAVSWPPPGHK